jgi:hypothetical protein
MNEFAIRSFTKVAAQPSAKAKSSMSVEQMNQIVVS